MVTDILTVYLEGLPGRLQGAADADEIAWQADSEGLDRSLEDAAAFLDGRRGAPDGCLLTVHFAAGESPELREDRRVDIVNLELDRARQVLVAALRVRRGRSDHHYTNGDIDDASEASFPASDPPAFNPGKA